LAQVAAVISGVEYDVRDRLAANLAAAVEAVGELRWSSSFGAEAGS
jgi:hypothetical protein